MERRAIVIQGIVQGVGFRPFVFGLATRLAAFAAHVDAWIGGGGRNAAELHRDLAARGCRASYDAVRRHVARRLGSAGRAGRRSFWASRSSFRTVSRGAVTSP